MSNPERARIDQLRENVAASFDQESLHLGTSIASLDALVEMAHEWAHGVDHGLCERANEAATAAGVALMKRLAEAEKRIHHLVYALELTINELDHAYEQPLDDARRAMARHQTQTLLAAIHRILAGGKP